MPKRGKRGRRGVARKSGDKMDSVTTSESEDRAASPDVIDITEKCNSPQQQQDGHSTVTEQHADNSAEEKKVSGSPHVRLTDMDAGIEDDLLTEGSDLNNEGDGELLAGEEPVTIKEKDKDVELDVGTSSGCQITEKTALAKEDLNNAMGNAESDHDVTETIHDGTEIRCDVTENIHDGTEIRLDVTENIHDGTEIRLDVTENIHDGTEIRLDVTENIHDGTEIRPDVTENIHDGTEIRRDETENIHDGTEIRLDVTENIHDGTEIRRDVTENIHDGTEIRRDVTENIHDGTEIRHHVTENIHDGTEIRRDVTENIHDGTEIRLDVTENIHDGTEIRLDVTENIHDGTEIRPDVTENIHDGTEIRRDVTENIHDGTEIRHHVTENIHDGTEIRRDVTENIHDGTEIRRDVTENIHDGTEIRRDVTENIHDGTEIRRDETENIHDGAEIRHDVTEIVHEDIDPEVEKKVCDIQQESDSVIEGEVGDIHEEIDPEVKKGVSDIYLEGSPVVDKEDDHEEKSDSVQYIDEEAEDDLQLSDIMESTDVTSDTKLTESISNSSQFKETDKTGGNLPLVTDREEASSSKFEEISDGSIDQDDVINLVEDFSSSESPRKSNVETSSRIRSTSKRKTRIPYKEAESLEEVFFATENDMMGVKVVAEDKDNDEISDASLCDHLSLEEISDEDIETSKKRRKSAGHVSEQDPPQDAAEVPMKVESGWDPSLEHKRYEPEVGPVNKRTIDQVEDASNDYAVKRFRQIPEKKEGIREVTSQSEIGTEAAYYTGLCGNSRKIEEAEKREPSPRTPPQTVRQDRSLSQSGRDKAYVPKERSDQWRKHLVSLSTQTEPVGQKGKIVQCNIKPIKVPVQTENDVKNTSISLKFLETFQPLFPRSIPENICADIVSLHPAAKDGMFTFSMGPVTLSDMDSATFRNSVLQGAEKFSLTFDKNFHGIFNATIVKQEDMVRLIRDLKRLELGNRYMVMALTYRPPGGGEKHGAGLWKATIVFMYQQDIQHQGKTLVSDGKVRAKLDLNGVPDQVSKDFVQILFPEVLSVTSQRRSGQARIVTLGICNPQSVEEIYSCYDLIIINGLQVKLTKKICVEETFSNTTADFVEEAGVVVLQDMAESKAVLDLTDPVVGSSPPPPLVGKTDTSGDEWQSKVESSPSRVVPREKDDSDIVDTMLETIKDSEMNGPGVAAESSCDGCPTDQALTSEEGMVPGKTGHGEEDKAGIEGTPPGAEAVGEEGEKVLVHDPVTDASSKADTQLTKENLEDTVNIVPNETEDLDEKQVENRSKKRKTTDREDVTEELLNALTKSDKTNKKHNIEQANIQNADDIDTAGRIADETVPVLDVGGDGHGKDIPQREVEPVVEDDVGGGGNGKEISQTEVDPHKGDANEKTAPNKVESVNFEDVSDEEITHNQSKVSSKDDDVVILMEEPCHRVVANIDLTGDDVESGMKTVRAGQNALKASIKARKPRVDKLVMTDGSLEVAMEVVDVEDDDEGNEKVLYSTSKSWSDKSVDHSQDFGKQVPEKILHKQGLGDPWHSSSSAAPVPYSLSHKDVTSKYSRGSRDRSPGVVSKGSHKRSGSSRDMSPQRYRVPAREQTSERRDHFRKWSSSPLPKKDPLWGRTDKEIYYHSRPRYAAAKATDYSYPNPHNRYEQEKWSRTYESLTPDHKPSYREPRRSDSHRVYSSVTGPRDSPPAYLPPQTSWQDRYQLSRGRSRDRYSSSHYSAHQHEHPRLPKLPRSRSRSRSLSDMSISGESLRRRSISKEKTLKRPLKYISRSPISVSSRSRSLSPVSKSPSPIKERSKDKLVDTVKHFLHLAKNLQQSHRSSFSKSPSPSPDKKKWSRSPNSHRYIKIKKKKSRSPQRMRSPDTAQYALRERSRSPEYVRSKYTKHGRSQSPRYIEEAEDRKYRSYRHHQDDEARSYQQEDDSSRRYQSIEDRAHKEQSKYKSSQWLEIGRSEPSEKNDQKWESSYRSTSQKQTHSSNPGQSYSVPPPNTAYPPPGYPSGSSFPSYHHHGGYPSGPAPVYQYGASSQYGYSNVLQTMPSPFPSQIPQPPMPPGYHPAFSVIAPNMSAPPHPSYPPLPHTERASGSGSKKTVATSQTKKNWSMGGSPMVFQRILTHEGNKVKKKSGSIQTVGERERQERPRVQKEVRVLACVPKDK